jgi:hypothetical protein
VRREAPVFRVNRADLLPVAWKNPAIFSDKVNTTVKKPAFLAKKSWPDRIRIV